MVFITFIVISFHKPFVVNLVVILKFSQFPPSLPPPPPKKKPLPRPNTIMLLEMIKYKKPPLRVWTNTKYYQDLKKIYTI